ncbi:hypothetical protein [Robertkochia sediminum]|uniref:hypothetical protein n=1 Tax=Robertkochia sediminum TaxID=2785326 RepID=UPI00193446D1|nr:hypothetical protein [Robertkochia sediminum]MBL7471302.1 hypothetical protein [Robertkochia sediminum]
MRALYLLFLAGILLSFSASVPEVADTAIRIKDSSSLNIIGKTNVHTFTCKYDVAELTEPVKVDYTATGDAMVFGSAVLRLRNENFDCGGRGINNDFNKLLKTPVYPEVILGLQKIVAHPHIDDNYIASVALSIAGTTRHYDLFLKVTGQDNMEIKGVMEIKLPDFGLEPPQRALGMIKVQENLVIEFLLDMEEVG